MSTPGRSLEAFAPRPTLVLWMGDVDWPEFRQAARCISTTARLVSISTVDEADRRIARGEFIPDLMVFAHRRPGEWSLAQVNRLLKLVPLARAIDLLGSWCEGETRSARPLPGLLRIFWYDWPSFWRREIASALAGRRSSWTQPVTSTREDRLLEASPARRRAESRGVVVVQARRFDTAAPLLDACRGAGGAAVWSPPHEPVRVAGAAVGIWCGTDCNDQEAAELAALSRQIPKGRVLALLDFPRLHEIEKAQQAGAAEVLARPFSLDDLLDRLDGWTARDDPVSAQEDAA